MNKLFEEKIEHYDLLQLENWITRCRTAIEKEDFDSNTPEDDYKEVVLDFVEEWKEHYEDNDDIYEKDDFKKAILANGLNLDKIVLILEKGKKTKKIDLTEKLYNSFLNNDDIGIFQNLMSDYKNKRINKINDYFELIKDLDYIEDYKQKIVELIRNKTKYEILSYTATIQDETIFEIQDIDELLDALVVDIEVEPAILEITDKEFPFLNSINAFDITRQVFYDFEEEANKVHSNKYFNKKFFINTGLYLSLNFELFEMFLNLFGYTVENSRVERDRLLTEFIDIGFSKEYIDISIEANNLRPLTARVAGYQKRDLNLIDEFFRKSSYTIGEVKELKITLLYGITKLKSFIENKEESIRRTNNKFERLHRRLELEKEMLSKAENELEKYEAENFEDEENYRKEISDNNKNIYKLKHMITTTIEEKEKIKNELDYLVKENKKLTDMANNIRAEILELKRSRNAQAKILKSTEKSLNNTKNKLDRLCNEKYKSIDVFDKHIEQYNNLTLVDIKNLLNEFEELYNKDYIP
ncbi:hypothetical protein [Tissierella sp. Yu-01]|uniref:hypothetical protein n=1 Tax=Tissierella sp. Yu-01 TaxID=3035694 RepID=UPI00240D87FD|nr:hypothetical protein [Tissierella sp. Yu-01]WFA09575.1 hypothetical protein P3962_03205 [Tissierella sp. Yu-01]